MRGELVTGARLGLGAERKLGEGAWVRGRTVVCEGALRPITVERLDERGDTLDRVRDGADRLGVRTDGDGVDRLGVLTDGALVLGDGVDRLGVLTDGALVLGDGVDRLGVLTDGALVLGDGVDRLGVLTDGAVVREADGELGSLRRTLIGARLGVRTCSRGVYSRPELLPRPRIVGTSGAAVLSDPLTDRSRLPGVIARGETPSLGAEGDSRRMLRSPSPRRMLLVLPRMPPMSEVAN